MVQTKERVETHKRMSRIIERAEAPDEQTVQILAYVEAHYETQEVPHGKVYVWWPECFLVLQSHLFELWRGCSAAFVVTAHR